MIHKNVFKITMTDFTLIKRLFNITQDNGFSPDEISKHQSICPTIPKVLFNFYTQLGKENDLNHTQDHLLNPDELYISKCGGYLIFYVENQEVCFWGIPLSQLTHADPAVYISTDEQTWALDHQRLSEFLHSMAFLQGAFGLPFSCEEFIDIDDTMLSFIQTNFRQKPYEFPQWNVSFYGNSDDDVIAIFKDNNSHSMIYASNNQQGFDVLDNALCEYDD